MGRICKLVAYFCIGLLSVLCILASNIEPQVFTVYKTKKSWNEAREICDMNNNTLLTIPDEYYWEFWKWLLNPEGGAYHRTEADSRYWFGLHAPNPSNLTSLFWADCTHPQWIEWTSDGRSYIVNQPCLAFDVYFKPFSTILLKIWLAEDCTKEHYFVCSESVNTSSDTCIPHGCDEYVHIVADSNACDSLCVGQANCQNNYTQTPGFGLCHIFYLVPYPNSNFYRVCFLPEGDVTISGCHNDQWFDDLGSVINADMDPGGDCLNLETSSTHFSTQAVTTDATQVSTTNEISSSHETVTTSEPVTEPVTISEPVTEPVTTTEVTGNEGTTESSQLCQCPCNSGSTDDMTIEEKVEQLKRELKVDKKNTSLHKRKFISASDSRLSATGIGSVGVAILVAVLLAICLMDIGAFKSDLQNLYQNVIRCDCKKKKNDNAHTTCHTKKVINTRDYPVLCETVSTDRVGEYFKPAENAPDSFYTRRHTYNALTVSTDLEKGSKRHSRSQTSKTSNTSLQPRTIASERLQTCVSVGHSSSMLSSRSSSERSYNGSPVPSPGNSSDFLIGRHTTVKHGSDNQNRTENISNKEPYWWRMI